MVIDFRQYVEQKEAERNLIEAETVMVAAREKLAYAYAHKGLVEIFETNGIVLTDKIADVFVPLMVRAIEQGLNAGEIEDLVIMSIQDVCPDVEEIEFTDE